MANQNLTQSIAALDGMLFIDGAFRAGQGMRLPVQNPATGEVIGQIAAATAADIEAAVQAARRAFRPWAAELTSASPPRWSRMARPETTVGTEPRKPQSKAPNTSPASGAHSNHPRGVMTCTSRSSCSGEDSRSSET